MSTKRKLPTKLGQPHIRPSAKVNTRVAISEGRAVVTGGGQADTQFDDAVKDTIDISSDESSDAEGEIEAEQVNDQDTAMTEVPQVEDDDQIGEPTFGDLIRTTLTEPIDVAAPFAPAATHAPNNLIAAPSGTSLGTVLTQALKTNDNTLLESCLQTTDLKTIRTTIQRLSSPLASSLLMTLASRLHRRPGRAGSLMVWIQWTLVSHGGYLAMQPELIKQLAALNRVIDERARGLQGLLMLKGKLDMLEAQGQLRKAMLGRNRGAESGDEEEEDEAVVYVEDQPDSSDDEGAAVTNGASNRQAIVHDEEDDDDEEMPNTSAGVVDETDDDESDDGSQGLIDDEAEESEEESGDEDQINYEDEDEMESGDETDEAAPARSAPPAKMQKRGGLFSKR